MHLRPISKTLFYDDAAADDARYSVDATFLLEPTGRRHIEGNIDRLEVTTNGRLGWVDDAAVGRGDLYEPNLRETASLKDRFGWFTLAILGLTAAAIGFAFSGLFLLGWALGYFSTPLIALIVFVTSGFVLLASTVGIRAPNSGYREDDAAFGGHTPKAAFDRIMTRLEARQESHKPHEMWQEITPAAPAVAT